MRLEVDNDIVVACRHLECDIEDFIADIDLFLQKDVEDVVDRRICVVVIGKVAETGIEALRNQ